jgi:ATP-dependent RNA helicase SUPV3L1/SUV3
MSMRTRRVVAAKDDAFTLTRQGRIIWRNDEIARLDVGDDALKPQVTLIADDSLQGADRERVLLRVQTWLSDTIAERLKPLVEISKAEDIEGLARGVAFRLTESVGVLKRESVADEMKALDQAARAQLRRYGVRFGAFNIFFPTLLKPAAADLLLTLWCLRYGKEQGIDPETPPEAPRAGLTSAKVDPAIPEAFYRAYGFHVCGPRAVRIDMLERLADLIRPLLAWRSRSQGDAPPKGSTGDGGFTVIPEMMSILGCSPEELGNVLAALGFRLEKREVAVPKADAAEQAASHPASRAGTGPDVSSRAAFARRPAAPPVSEVTAKVNDASVAATPSNGDARPGAMVDAAPVAGVAGSQDAASTAPEAAAEPEIIEIWRPRRRYEGSGPRRARGRNRGGDRDAAAGNRSAPRSNNGEARQDGAPAGRRPGQAERDGRPGGGGRRRDNQRPGQHGKGGGAGRGKPRFDKSGGGRRDEKRRGPNVHTSAPAPVKGIDPDSPFAALSALKESLGKGGGDN